jgi:hypothetical protein
MARDTFPTEAQKSSRSAAEMGGVPLSCKSFASRRNEQVELWRPPALVWVDGGM